MKQEFPSFPGYHVLDELYIGSKSIVYRAEGIEKKEKVVLKLPAEESPSPRLIAGIRHEYELLKNITHPNLVQVHSIIQLRQVPMLVREDFDGISLASLLRNPLPVNEFLKLSFQMVEALAIVHKSGIIHKDIKPANFIVHPETRLVKLTDFSISSTLPREVPDLERIEGTLAYISPEQTGRMNHSLDLRTDLYSLGATFYEMLTGFPPFKEEDTSGLIHAHLARIPVNLTEYQIPEVISNIVMKLLAKDPVERYQSANGLQEDLKRCLQDYTKGNLKNFSVGMAEEETRFQIPEKLYGREKEAKELLNVFENIVKGNREVVFVSGFSGIGKTALIHEVHKPLARERGRFIVGKFDQFRRNIPYAAFIQAFQDLIKRILILDKTELNSWRAKIRNSLGEEASVIVDILPDLALIIGTQNPARPLPAHEAQKRFQELFYRFVQVFTNVPLILFLDDLQWADTSSLDLLESLVSDTGNLLFVGAYRDNEVNSDHPFSILKTRLERNLKVKDLQLKPLSKKALCSLLTDTIRKGGVKPEDQIEINDLCELVTEKTRGNPFFVNQFLRTLVQNNLIYYDTRWVWDLEKIRLADLTDNVVELMAGRIKLLPKSTRTTLSLAAVMGAKFSLYTLAVVSEISPRLVFQNLWAALKAGLILPIDENYRLMNLSDEELSRIEPIIDLRFLHDRVQQAAYSLLPTEELPQVHLTIGRLLLKNAGEDNENLFEIINHLNFGYKVINDQTELETLASLNLKAARRAKESVAYESAVDYANQGLAILNLYPQNNSELRFKLLIESGEALYLRGEYSLAEDQFTKALTCAKDRMERVQVQNLRVVLYTSQGEFKRALEVGREALVDLDYPLSDKNLKMQTMKHLKEFERILNNRPIEDIYDLPTLKDPRLNAIVELLINMTAASYLTDTSLAAINALLISCISLEHGNAIGSAWGYINVGTVLTAFSRMDDAYRLGLLSLKLNERDKAKEQRCKILCMFGFYISHWKRHLKESQVILAEAHKVGIETGDAIYASYALLHDTFIRFQAGENLVDLEDKVKRHHARVAHQKFTDGMLAFDALLHLIRRLRGIDDNFNSSDFQEALKTSEMPLVLHVYSIFTLYSKVVIENSFEEAVVLAEDCIAMSAVSGGMLHLVEQTFLQSLVIIELFRRGDKSELELRQKRLASNRKQLATWAENCPENFKHKTLLIEAEFSDLEENEIKAIQLYEDAIESAQENDFINNVALCTEFAARFHARRGRKRYSRFFFGEARRHWETIGATAKVNELTRYTYNKSTSSATLSDTSSTVSASLDLQVILKSSQAISQVMERKILLHRIMEIIAESSGAKTGFLLQEEQGEILVVASNQKEEIYDLPLNKAQGIAKSIVNYVFHTRKSLVLSDAISDSSFGTDPHVEAVKLRSVLCEPILHQGKLLGIIYLENNLATNVFNKGRLEIVRLLCAQAAISLENSKLYTNMEIRVQERTRELQAAMDLARSSQSKIAALNDFAKEVNSANNLDKVLDQIFGYIKENFNIDAIVIGLPDITKKVISFYRAEVPEDFSEINYQLLKNTSVNLEHHESIIVKSIKRKRPVSLRRLPSKFIHPVDQMYIDLGIKSILLFPLIVRDEIVGSLLFASLYEEMDMKIFMPDLKSFCEQIAGAINNSNLLGQTEKAKAETESLNELMKNINSVSSLVDIMSFLMYFLETEYEFTDFYLLLNDTDQEQFIPFSFTSSQNNKDVRDYFMNFRMSYSELSGVFANILKEKKIQFIEKENIQEADLMAKDWIEKGQFYYILLLPLVIYDELIGILFLHSPKRKTIITNEILRKLERFSDLIAGSVFNARLLKKVEYAKEEADKAKEQAEIEKSIAQIAQVETEKERNKSEKLLLNILPLKVANELKEKGYVEPVYFENATIMFTDFKGFTQIAEGLTPQELIKELDGCFTQFDQITGRNNLEKLKTIGDAYMCAGGLPKVNTTHAVDACLAALEIQAFMNQMKEIKQIMGNPYWELRLGIHSGPLMAGVVGEKKFAYDVWGDTVNTASRMESSGTPGKVNISYATYELVKHLFDCEYRGEIDAKNKGKIKMYYLIRLKKEYAKDEEGRIPNGSFWENYF